MDTQAHIVATCQHTAVIHIFCVHPVSIERHLHAPEVCLTADGCVSELLYPREVPLETVDVQLRLLGVDVGADGEKVLRQGQKEEEDISATTVILS